MIVRSRPKFISYRMFNKIPCQSYEDVDNLFFNYGRSALLFFFSCYREFYHKKLRIGLQSFNCPVVMEGILQSGNWPVLLDISLEDFSVSLEELSHIEEGLDIMILTSYQGIPPLEYKEIAGYCTSRSIFLMEDLSHTYGSSIKGIKTGTLSEASLFSYAFDKPFSSYFGGMLDIKNIQDQTFRDFVITEYQKVVPESCVKTTFDLRMLKTLLLYTEPEKYQPAFDISYFFYFPKLVFIFAPLLLHFSYIRKIFSAAVARLLGFQEPDKKITVRRLRNRKIRFIRQQETAFTYNNSEVEALEEFLTKYNLKPIRIASGEIHWNRYAVLDPDYKIRQDLKDIGVQSGNYNWPVPMHIMYAGNKNCFFKNENGYPNSEYASKHIVNIPVWSDFFQKRLMRDPDGQ